MLWLLHDSTHAAGSIAIQTFSNAGGATLQAAVGGWLFHQVHLFYSAVSFALVSLRHALRSHS